MSAVSVIQRLGKSSYVRRIFFFLAAAVSAIIIVSAAASYLVMRSQIVRANEERTIQALRQASARFGSTITSSIIPAAEQVYEARTINKFIYSSRLTDRDILDTSQLLDRFKLANPLISSILAYNHQLGLIYSTSDGILPATTLRHHDIMAIMQNIRTFGVFRIIPRVDDGTNVFTIVVGAAPFNEGPLLGGLVVNVDERAVRDQLRLPRFRAARNFRNLGSREGPYCAAGVALCHRRSERPGSDACFRRGTRPGGQRGFRQICRGPRGT